MLDALETVKVTLDFLGTETFIRLVIDFVPMKPTAFVDEGDLVEPVADEARVV